MSKPTRPRRLIALFAAYVVALQALLLPLTVAAGASLDAHLCVTSAAVDGSPAPAGHDNACPCAAGCGTQCCAQTLAAPPQAASAFGPAGVATKVAAPVFELALAPTHRSFQRARAPPIS